MKREIEMEGGVSHHQNHYAATPITPPSPSPSPSPSPKLTAYAFFTCLLAASGGLMYGYDLVVAGIYIYIHTHTHTHSYIYIYIYIYISITKLIPFLLLLLHITSLMTASNLFSTLPRLQIHTLHTYSSNFSSLSHPCVRACVCPPYRRCVHHG